MLKNLESPAGESNSAYKPTFVTIDDCILWADRGLQIIQKVTEDLHRLGECRHPLAVRRGYVLNGKGVENVTSSDGSIQIKTNSRTYFFDVGIAANSKSYLRITESRFKDGKQERNSLVIFPEDASKFVKAVLKMSAKIN